MGETHSTMSPQEILGCTFLQSSDGTPITGQAIVNAFWETWNRNPSRIIRHGAIRMSTLSTLLKKSLKLPEVTCSNPEGQRMKSSDALYASTGIYALETAGLLKRRGYNREKEMWYITLSPMLAQSITARQNRNNPMYFGAHPAPSSVRLAK